MGLQELGHVVLHVTDLEDSRRFQRDTLGWPELAGDLEQGSGAPDSVGRQITCDALSSDVHDRPDAVFFVTPPPVLRRRRL